MIQNNYSTLAYGLFMILEISANEIVIFILKDGTSDAIYNTADSSKYILCDNFNIHIFKALAYMWILMHCLDKFFSFSFLYGFLCKKAIQTTVKYKTDIDTFGVIMLYSAPCSSMNLVPYSLIKHKIPL